MKDCVWGRSEWKKTVLFTIVVKVSYSCTFQVKTYDHENRSLESPLGALKWAHVGKRSFSLSFISFMAKMFMHILIIFSHTSPHFPVTPVFSYCSYFKPRYPCMFLHCPLGKEDRELHHIFQCLSKYLAKRCWLKHKGKKLCSSCN